MRPILRLTVPPRFMAKGIEVRWPDGAGMSRIINLMWPAPRRPENETKKEKKRGEKKSGERTVGGEGKKAAGTDVITPAPHT